MLADRSPLATFLDRHTMVYERLYPHDIELVWEAVSTGEHLDVWLLPESRVERRAGGACAFGWGSPADDPAATRGVVSVFDPPTAVQYTFEDGESFMRFDLAAEAGATRLQFTLHFVPKPDEPADEPWPGGDLPAGTGTAWRPGFIAGYHEFLDDLFGYLDGTFTVDDRAAMLSGGESAPHDELVDAYRQRIREDCPPE